MGDVGIVWRLAADRDQVSLTLFEDRFSLVRLEDDSDAAKGGSINLAACNAGSTLSGQ
jgi:hypothetical protein